MQTWTLKDLGLDAASVGSASSAIQVVSNLAPQQERKGIIFEGDPDEAISKLVDAIRKEGSLP
jgi:electron transfer flavoprotein alpha/beta subunit